MLACRPALINPAQRSFAKLRMRETESDVMYRRAQLQLETWSRVSLSLQRGIIHVQAKCAAAACTDGQSASPQLDYSSFLSLTVLKLKRKACSTCDLTGTTELNWAWVPICHSEFRKGTKGINRTDKIKANRNITANSPVSNLRLKIRQISYPTVVVITK